MFHFPTAVLLLLNILFKSHVCNVFGANPLTPPLHPSKSFPISSSFSFQISCAFSLFKIQYPLSLFRATYMCMDGGLTAEA